MAPVTVSDRLAERRANLAPYCQMDPVKQHLRLVSYYELARQLYRQTETYAQEEAWDTAYVFIAKFTKLCSKVIPAHRDYQNPKYHKERDWIGIQAQTALRLFDVILDGMEDNERELMKEEEEREQELRKQAALTVATASAPPPPPPPTTTPKPAAELSLEDRLAALRLRKAQAEDTSSARVVEPLRQRGSYSAVPTTRSTFPVVDQEHRLTKSSVAYPSVGKTHWMEGTSTEVAAPPSSPRRPRRLGSNRQLSLAALHQLSSGRLRNLEIPTNIITQFTAIAAPNTNRFPDGIETCGILAGKLVGTILVITTLIIPKQEGSSDMCSMNNEEELFDFCFSNELLTLGWIHTHPRQDCFLSSVDIHTQCGFQSILPEAIAIVVAPRDLRRNVGIFRLSEPDGMQLIQHCSLTGFHVHPEHIQIYSDALACDWNPRTTPVIVDMRLAR